MARDWGGNNVAVDLAPGPTGKWGQIIIFGRDYDCKYVVARSWSAFLAMVADDMCGEKVFVDEETQELKLREFKTSTVEPGYLDILRWRMDQKYGRKGPRRKPTNGFRYQHEFKCQWSFSVRESQYWQRRERRVAATLSAQGSKPSSPRGTMGKSRSIGKSFRGNSSANRGP
jgi:hypothetical protein